jgi:hypothetical protein
MQVKVHAYTRLSTNLDVYESTEIVIKDHDKRTQFLRDTIARLQTVVDDCFVLFPELKHVGDAIAAVKARYDPFGKGADVEAEQVKRDHPQFFEEE